MSSPRGRRKNGRGRGGRGGGRGEGEKRERASKKPEHRYLEISRWQFVADSSIIFKFITLRVEGRVDGPFSL